jgi:hypothetical protein
MAGRGLCSFTEVGALGVKKPSFVGTRPWHWVSETKPSWSRKDFSVIDNHPIDIGRVRTVVRQLGSRRSQHLRPNPLSGGLMSAWTGASTVMTPGFPFNEPGNGTGGICKRLTVHAVLIDDCGSILDSKIARPKFFRVSSRR